MRLTSLLWLPLSVLITVSVEAAPISVTTGAPNGSRFAISEWYLMADDFSFSVDTILTHMASPGHDAGTWVIFDKNADLSHPGELLAYGTIGPLDADGRFPVTHLLLTGGLGYWYGFYNAPLDQCPELVGGGSSFSGTGTNGSATALVLTHSRRRCTADVLDGWLNAFNSPQTYWLHNELPRGFTDLSFSAYGQTVPEPASVLLVSVGLAMVLRRGRAGKTSTDL